MPPVLHRQAEAGGHRRPRGALPAPLRRAQGRQVAAAPGLDPERRAGLLGAKLGALVASGFGVAEREVRAFGLGAALMEGDRAFVLVESDSARSLGPALAWAEAAGVAQVEILLDGTADGGVVARRAAAFDPPPAVWRVVGRSLASVAATPLAPEPSVDDRLLLHQAELLAAGCDVVVEHRRLVGEVAGLEVARVTLGDDGEAVLELGVGRFDREAHAMLTGGEPTLEGLRSVVDQVSEVRRVGSPDHPLRRLARERWLRRLLIETPSLVGARSLRAVPAVLEAPDLRTPTPAAAVGEDVDGRPVVVVCSIGVDLDLVPTAADERLAAVARDGLVGPRLVLALPQRDAIRPTRALAALLADPADVRTVDLASGTSM